MKILFIDIDSLRPDHLGCYGYHRNTSPNIDIVAREGVRFDRYYCSDAPCLPSRTALYTGLFGIASGVIGHGGTASDLRPDGPAREFLDRVEMQALPSVLRGVGFHTAAFSSFATRHAARQFYAGFLEIHNCGLNGQETADQITPGVLRWLTDHAQDDNWYLHVNYWDPHTPYRTPLSYDEPFANDPLPAWLTEKVLETHLQAVGPHTAQDLSMRDNYQDPRYPRQPGSIRNRNDLRRMIDGYDTGVRYADDHVGQLIACLKDLNILDETAIIITADHGENLGELGLYGEHATADQMTCRLPMIIRWPGTRAGTVDKGLHYHLDFAPTLVDMLGHPPQPMWQGASFAQALRKEDSAGRDYLVIGQCAHVCQRSVLFENWIYIRTYHDGFHLFPQEMLFDLEIDPHEQNDIATTHPDICNRALRHLGKWHDQMMPALGNNPDPLWTVMNEGGPFHARLDLKSYARRLESTGRGWAVDALRRRHPDKSF